MGFRQRHRRHFTLDRCENTSCVQTSTRRSADHRLYLKIAATRAPAIHSNGDRTDISDMSMMVTTEKSLISTGAAAATQGRHDGATRSSTDAEPTKNANQHAKHCMSERQHSPFEATTPSQANECTPANTSERSKSCVAAPLSRGRQAVREGQRGGHY